MTPDSLLTQKLLLPISYPPFSRSYLSFYAGWITLSPENLWKKFDFIVENSLTISPEGWKTRKRTVNSSEICTTSLLVTFLHPFLSSAILVALPFFMQKGYKWIERENDLLIFSSMLFLSQHFNPFVTIFNSNKPFYALRMSDEGKLRKDDEMRSTSLIFLLECFCCSVD